MNKKLFDFKALGRIYNDVDLNSYTVNVDAFIINGVVIATTDLNSDLIDDLENSMLEAIYNAGLPSAGLNLTVINNNNGTFTVTFTLPSSYYAGIDYGLVSGNYTASAMSYQTPGVPGILRFGTSHEILIPENGNALLNEVYFFRLSVGTSSYVDSGYVTSEQTISLDDVAPILSSANAGTPTITGTNGARVTTDTASGVLYWAVVTNGGSCTDAQLKAGTGGNILQGGNQVVTVAGIQTIPNITGLSEATSYQIKFLHRDVSGNDSIQASINLTTDSSSIPLSFDAASTSSETTSGSQNWNHVIGASSKKIFVDVAWNNVARTINTITCGGQAMTFVDSVTNATSGYVLARYGLLNPPTGTQAITIAFDGTCRSRCSAVSYVGGDTTTLIRGASSKATNSGTAVTVNQTSNVADDVLATVVSDDATATFTPTDEQQRNNVTTTVFRLFTMTQAGAASVTMSGTLSLFRQWQILASSVKGP